MDHSSFRILTDERSLYGCRMDHLSEYWQMGGACMRVGGEWAILQNTDRWEKPVWAENGPFFWILTDERSLYGCRMDHSSEYWQMGEACMVVRAENGPLCRILTDMRGTCWRFNGQQRMACAWRLLVVHQNMPLHTGSCLRNSQTLSKDHFPRRRNCSITHTVWTQVSSWINIYNGWTSHLSCILFSLWYNCIGWLGVKNSYLSCILFLSSVVWPLSSLFCCCFSNLPSADYLFPRPWPKMPFFQNLGPNAILNTKHQVIYLPKCSKTLA